MSYNAVNSIIPTLASGGDLLYNDGTGNPIDIAVKGYGIKDLFRNLNCVYSDALDNAATGYDTTGTGWGNFPEDTVRLLFTLSNATPVTVGTGEFIGRSWEQSHLIDKIQIDFSAVGNGRPSAIDVYFLKDQGDITQLSDWELVLADAAIGADLFEYNFTEDRRVRGIKIVSKDAGNSDWLNIRVYVKKITDECSRNDDFYDTDFILVSEVGVKTFKFNMVNAIHLNEIRWYSGEILDASSEIVVETSQDDISYVPKTLSDQLTNIDGPLTSTTQGITAIQGANTDSTTKPNIIIFKPNDGTNFVDFVDGIMSRLEVMGRVGTSGATINTTVGIVRKVIVGALARYVVVAIMKDTNNPGYSNTVGIKTYAFTTSTNRRQNYRCKAGDFLFISYRSGWATNYDMIFYTITGTGTNTALVAYGRWNPYAGLTECKVGTAWTSVGTYRSLTEGTGLVKLDCTTRILQYKKAASLAEHSSFIRVKQQNLDTLYGRSFGHLQVVTTAAKVKFYPTAGLVTEITEPFEVKGSPGVPPAENPVYTVYIKNNTGVTATGLLVYLSDNPDKGNAFLEISFNNDFSVDKARNCNYNDLDANPKTCSVNNYNWAKTIANKVVGCGRACQIVTGVDPILGKGLDGVNAPTNGFARDSLFLNSSVNDQSAVAVYIRANIPAGESITVLTCALEAQYKV